VKCNITSWDDQVDTFEAAIKNSPYKSCDIVIANAGISRASGDDLWPLDGKYFHSQDWESCEIQVAY
jgi:NAD(P)-dependent dehydrogenase (short-subunit alcohol dehydrogenase family)